MDTNVPPPIDFFPTLLSFPVAQVTYVRPDPAQPPPPRSTAHPSPTMWRTYLCLEGVLHLYVTEAFTLYHTLEPGAHVTVPPGAYLRVLTAPDTAYLVFWSELSNAVSPPPSALLPLPPPPPPPPRPRSFAVPSRHMHDPSPPPPPRPTTPFKGQSWSY